MVENIKKEYKIIDFIIFTPKKMHYQSYKNAPREGGVSLGIPTFGQHFPKHNLSSTHP